MRDAVKNMLVLLGTLLYRLRPYSRVPEVFFLFPFYHVGGAEQVHADIVRKAAGKNPLIVITHSSRGNFLRETFAGSGTLLEISKWTGNPVSAAVMVGYLAACINSSSKPMVFAANTPFFYTVLPYLKQEAFLVDLIHAFGGGMETVSLPHAARINRRIVIDFNTYDSLEQMYVSAGLPMELLKRVDLVENGVAVPALKPEKGANQRLQILYVGRGSKEKRVHIVGKVASVCRERGLAVDFTLVGELEGEIDAVDRPHCRFTGEITDRRRIAEIYRGGDLLLLTSEREGFPLVLMEAMAHGVVPVSTDVGGIGRHLHHGENSFLVMNSPNEAEIVGYLAEIVENACRDRQLLSRLSDAAYAYAARHFSGEGFHSYYERLCDGTAAMRGA